MSKKYALVIRNALEADDYQDDKVLEIRDVETDLPVASMPVQVVAEILLKEAFLRFIST
jgi:hypothetical protein